MAAPHTPKPTESPIRELYDNNITPDELELAEWKRKDRIPNKLRERVFRRDGRQCVKCGSPNGLHAHHIIAEADGGKTTFENLDTLCQNCHIEWHLVIRRTLPYEQWRTLPPANLIIFALLSDDPSAKKFKRFLLTSFLEATRQLREERK